MTITGRAVALAAAWTAVLVAVPRPATLWIGLAVLAALVTADLALAPSPARLSLARRVPPRVRLGEEARCVLSASWPSGPGRRAFRGWVRDAWPPSAGAGDTRHRLALAPGRTAELVTRLRPTRRGDRVAPFVVVRSLGPLGLAARQRTVPLPTRLRVLPPFLSRRHLPGKLARLRGLDGRTSVLMRGAGTEFDSLREYARGDDVRAIDWRATARREQLVVRTWRPERDRHVLIVLDTSRTQAGRIGDEQRLDAGMEAALLLAALASRAGDRVDFLAVDRRIRAHVAGRRGPGLLSALVDAMAPLEPALVEADWDLIVTTVLTRLTQRALVVLLTPLESAALVEGLLPRAATLAARHQLVVAAPGDPDVAAMLARRGEPDGAWDAAAAERALAERHALAEAMGRLGAEVVDAPPDRLASDLADRYLALKAAGRL